MTKMMNQLSEEELTNREKRRKERQEIYSTKEWREMSILKRQQNPLCEDCYKNNILTPATEVHHILSPFTPNITEEEKYRRAFAWDNIVALCGDCHHKRHDTQSKIKDKIKKYSI